MHHSCFAFLLASGSLSGSSSAGTRVFLCSRVSVSASGISRGTGFSPVSPNNCFFTILETTPELYRFFSSGSSVLGGGVSGLLAFLWQPVEENGLLMLWMSLVVVHVLGQLVVQEG